MLELICVRWYCAASYCWLKADIWFWAWVSWASMAAALALASEMASPAAGRAATNTVLDQHCDNGQRGDPDPLEHTRLLGDRGVEWCNPLYVSHDGDILIGRPPPIQTPSVLNARLQ